MEELTIKEGMWEECLDYAIKAKSHYTLLQIAKQGTSKNNLAEVKKWDKMLRTRLVELSTKYKCDINYLRALIEHLVEIMQLIPSEQLKTCDPTGSKFTPTAFRTWIYKKEK